MYVQFNMSPKAKILPLIGLCGIILGSSLSSASDWPSMNDTPSVILTSEGVILKDLKFFLYTQKNPNNSQELFYKNERALQNSFFNIRQPLKVVAHGWMNNHSSPVCVLVRQGLLNRGNFNVLVIDWGNIANQNYIYAANRVRAVAAFLGKMIDYLVDLGSDPKTISIIGHSLGAHVAGLAALQAEASISHIVGLDPAGPGFRVIGPEGRLSKTDAEYVEIIHTCGGLLGIFDQMGHADFYPNGGGPTQPGCALDPLGSCAHGRSYRYYAESLNNPLEWYAIKCNSSEDFNADKCNGSLIASFPRWKANFYKPHGIYQLRTASEAPYGLGINGTRPTDKNSISNLISKASTDIVAKVNELPIIKL